MKKYKMATKEDLDKGCIVIMGYKKEDAEDYKVGQNGKTFRVHLNKKLKLFDVITMDEEFGNYLIVEKVDGYEHTMSILGSKDNEEIFYSVANELRGYKPHWLVFKSYILEEVVERQKRRDEELENKIEEIKNDFKLCNIN